MTASGPATPRATSTPRCNPPVVRTPRLVQGVQFAIFRRRAMHTWIERHGRIFEINVPIFGRSVVVSDPTLVKLVSYDYGEPMSTKLVAIDTTTGTQIGSTIGLIPGPINYPVMSADGKLMLLYTYGPVNYSGKTLQSIFRLA